MPVEHKYPIGTRVLYLDRKGEIANHCGSSRPMYAVKHDEPITPPANYGNGIGPIAEENELVILNTAPTGGPSEYYDFPEGAITLNDLIEDKDMGFHRGNIFKACWRWGTKEGTSKEYDARKIIYSGSRLLKKIAGVKSLRETLKTMLNDPQFQERNKDE